MSLFKRNTRKRRKKQPVEAVNQVEPLHVTGGRVPDVGAWLRNPRRG